MSPNYEDSRVSLDDGSFVLNGEIFNIFGAPYIRIKGRSKSDIEKILKSNDFDIFADFVSDKRKAVVKLNRSDKSGLKNIYEKCQFLSDVKENLELDLDILKKRQSLDFYTDKIKVTENRVDAVQTVITMLMEDILPETMTDCCSPLCWKNGEIIEIHSREK